MEIRRIRLDEAELVARIYATEYAPGIDARPIVDWLSNCALHPKALCLLAEDEGQLVGFVIASQTDSPVMPGSAGEIEELHVRVDDRRGEVARALAEAAVSRLARRGVWMIRVDVDRDAAEWLRAAYSATGFGHDADRWSRYLLD